jgi:hypothetical protein
MAAAAYDPASDAWSELPGIPAGEAEIVPKVVSSGGVTMVRMAQAAVVLDRDGGWLPLPAAALPVDLGDAVAGPPGSAFAWGVLDGENRLATVDLHRLSSSPARVQAGAASVVVPPAYTVTGASLEGGAVVVDLAGPAGGCSVDGRSSAVAVTGRVVETTTTGGRRLAWGVEGAGTVWRTSLYESAGLTVACDDAATAELLARSVVL